ncbi:MAG: hypothetical protein ABIT83_09395 [Massilia sp.]
MSQQSAFDASIPLLTEVFQEKVDAGVGSVPAPQDETSADLEARAVASWTEPEWNLLERRLSERILQQLQGRVDFVLEQRLRDSMEAVMQRTLDGLTEEIGKGLQQTIEQVVLRAVAQEIAHLQTLKK